ncbi:MAG: type II toxin-antitoxin system RelE/ParE family toxin [Opitutaceae bacterium]
MKISISRSADRDLLAGFRFYESQTRGIGHYFLDSLFADIDSLVLFAGFHRKIQGFHRLLSDRFPFAIYYKIEDDTVRVRRVLDCRRDPTWVARQLKKG